MIRFIWLIGIIWISAINTQAQERQIEIINSDELSFDEKVINAKKLIGHVILKHDNALMYCDSAYLYDNENKFEAFRHVRINQGDSLTLNSDHLVYEGKQKIAHVDGDVRLTRRNMTLTTDRLDYDMNNQVATYLNKAKIVNGENTLVSTFGKYINKSNEFQFRKQVFLTNPRYRIYTDTMKYNTESDITWFLGPTTIVTKEKDTIICENGWYDTRKDIARFSRNAKIISGTQKLKADSITYNQNTGIGIGYKNIYFVDQAEQVTLLGNYGEFYQKTRSAFITQDALSIQIVDSDSVYTRADTLIYIGDSLSKGGRKILAYRHVKIYKSDIQSVADSMSYSLSDSIIRLYFNPILWNKENQLTADTIYIYQKNKNPDYIELRNKAFIASHERGKHYNQIKGKYIRGYFKNSELDLVKVFKEGESIYYIKEDSSHYTGINQITCDSMDIYIKEKEVAGIKFYSKNTGVIHPIKGADSSKLKLRGFKWHGDRRPMSPLEMMKK